MVQGPAIGVMIVGILGLALSALGLITRLSGFAFPMRGMDPQMEHFIRLFAGTFGLVTTGINIALSGIMLGGALKMRRLESYGLAMTASILAVIPCFSPCCGIPGIPLGIWALVVLSKPEVRAAFH